jgi:hypothetical protein
VPVTIVPSGGIPVTFDWIGRASALGYAAVADFNNDRYALPALGGELVTNGGFDTDLTGWTVAPANGATIVWDNGGVLFTGGGVAGNGNFKQAISVEVGKTYEIKFTGSGMSHKGCALGSSDGGTQYGVFDGANFPSGTKTVYFTATTAGLYLAFYVLFGVSTNWTLDNVSVKEVSLTQLRSVSRDEWFSQYTASSTTARSYQDSAGTIKTDLLANAARFDWTNGKRQLLLENAATNLCLRSSDMTVTPWTISAGAHTISGAQAAPDGSSSAVLLTDADATTISYLRQTVSGLANDVTYTSSFYGKAGSSPLLFFRFAFTGGATPVLITGYFNTATKAFTNLGGIGTLSYVELPGGWFRIAHSLTNNATGNNAVDFRLGVGDNANATVGSVYLWGAQFEASPFASAYIPTGASAVTRAIETFRLPPIVEAVLQRASGGVVVRGDLINTGLVSPGRRLVGLNGAGSLVVTSGSVDTQVSAYNNDAAIALTASLGAGKNYEPFGVAMAFDAAGRALSGNGGAVVSDVNGTGARTTIYLGRDGGGNYGDGRYDFLGILASRPSNAALQALAVPA